MGVCVSYVPKSSTIGILLASPLYLYIKEGYRYFVIFISQFYAITVDEYIPILKSSSIKHTHVNPRRSQNRKGVGIPVYQSSSVP